jgi:hypothetical protein
MLSNGDQPKASRQETRTPQLTRKLEYMARQILRQAIRQINETVRSLIHTPITNKAPPRKGFPFRNAYNDAAVKKSTKTLAWPRLIAARVGMKAIEVRRINLLFHAGCEKVPRKMAAERDATPLVKIQTAAPNLTGRSVSGQARRAVNGG